MRSNGSALAALAACGLVAALAGCGGDTSILVEVSRDEDVGAIERVAIFAGTDVVAGGGYADRTPDEDVVLDGRDLRDDPYRLALEPTDASAGRGVMVAAVAYRGDDVIGFGALAEPVGFVDGETVRWPLVIEAALPPGFEVAGDGCLRWYDADGDPLAIGRPPDLDCDGFADDDCDDLDPGVSPAALDGCGSGIDEDCDGAVDEDVDDDGDSFTTCGGDCDDRAAGINPGAVEACDGLDNDCAAGCDDGFDLDGDRYTTCGSKRHDDGDCDLDPALVDCDDGDDEVRPFAEETCDGLDNDCSGACDDDDDLDPDGDRYTACGSVVGACGTTPAAVDCAPDDEAIGPGAAELCNGVDDDCDEDLLVAAPCFVEVDGACYRGARACDEGGVGGFDGPCVTTALPADQVDPSLCDGYATCAAEDGEPDPYACALEEAADEVLLCVVGYDASTGAQCPGRTVPLPAGGSVTCTWRVVGGVDHGDYRVGLLPLGETELAPTGPCDSLLDVFLAATPASSQVAVLERLDDGQATVELRIEIAPLPAGTCSPPAGLTCAAPP